MFETRQHLRPGCDAGLCSDSVGCRTAARAGWCAGVWWGGWRQVKGTLLCRTNAFCLPPFLIPLPLSRSPLPFPTLLPAVQQELFTSLMGALKQDPATIKADAMKVLEWAKGKSEAEVVAAINGEDSSEVGAVLGMSKSDPDFLYTRNFGAGLIKTMQVVGVEPNSETSARWANAIGFTKKTSAVTDMSMSKFEADVGIFLSSVEKMQQAMQLYADIEAREKKKVAERLAEKAAKAAEDAAEDAASPA